MLILTVLPYLAVMGRHHLARIRDDERGEGVISTAIAVLVIAFLGVGAWTAFNVVLEKTSDKATACVDQIGASGTATC